MIRVEAYRQLRRLRTFLAFGGLAAFPIIVAIATRAHHPRGEDLQERTLFLVSTASGLNHALAALAFMSPFFLVIVVAMFAGESVAGEANWGTLRALLLRPVARARLLRAKLVVAGLMALLATLTIAIAGLGVGTLIFGWHPVATPFLTTIPATVALGRLGIACVYVAWGTAGIVAFGFMLSTLTDSPSGAIAGAIVLAVVSQILDSLPSLESIRPGLITHYWNAWAGLFLPQVHAGDMMRGVLIQVVYAGVFCAVAFWHFGRKDILS